MAVKILATLPHSYPYMVFASQTCQKILIYSNVASNRVKGAFSFKQMEEYLKLLYVFVRLPPVSSSKSPVCTPS